MTAKQHLASDFDICQYRRMSNQQGMRSARDPLADLACCALGRDRLTPEQASVLAGVFKALSDPVRLRLLSLIAAVGSEVCVCDLLEAFDLTGPTISHHLKVLRGAGLITGQRRGTWIYYRAETGLLTQLSAALGPAPDRTLVS